MAAANFLALLDDIATVLDDTATMTKVAAKKTSALVGDDLAVNADQVTGFPGDRELPVVWGVAKGAMVNKLVLIPVALLLSAYLPWLTAPLLMIGGTYLAYEGVHKIYHKLFHAEEDDKEKEELRKAFRDEDVDMVEYEQEKIRGAIWTDVILSAEILVLALGTVIGEPFVVQLGVLTAIGYGMVLVVYGSVAGIVKIDDLGLRLKQEGGMLAKVGDLLVQGAPNFMTLLGVAGTVAMLLVAGGIYAHNIGPVKELIHRISHASGVLKPVVPTVLKGGVGFVVGAVAVPVVGAVYTIFGLGGEGEH